jgi:5-methylcytosine-specific restriction endonuclease McrA
MSYAAKFKDPRWQKKRLEIFQRDGFKCRQCLWGKTTLHVHHRYYVPARDPWSYPDWSLVTLCEDCHSDVSGKIDQPENDQGPNHLQEWEQYLEAQATFGNLPELLRLS